MDSKTKAELCVTLAEYAAALFPASWKATPRIAPAFEDDAIYFDLYRVEWVSRVDDPGREGLPLHCFEIQESCLKDYVLKHRGIAEADSIEEVAKVVIRLIWEKRLLRFCTGRVSYEEIPF